MLLFNVILCFCAFVHICFASGDCPRWKTFIADDRLEHYRRVSDNVFLNALVRSCSNSSFLPIRLAPITFSSRCLQIFSHYFFAGGDACPIVHGCYPPRRLELEGGFVTDTVCDGNVPDRAALTEFVHCGINGLPWTFGFYRIQGDGIFFLPESCGPFQPLTCAPLAYDVEPGLRPPKTAYSAVPVYAEPEVGGWYGNRTLRAAHYTAPDGKHVCFSYLDYSYPCRPWRYTIQELRYHFALVRDAGPKFRALSPAWEYNGSHFIQTIAHKPRLRTACANVEASSRSIFSQFTHAAVTLIILVLRPLVSTLNDIFSSLFRDLVAYVFTESTLFILLQYSLLHAALYYFTANLYFHGLLALLFVYRSFFN